MAKPMGVTLPFVLLLLDYWPLGRTPWAKSAAGQRPMSAGRLIKEKVPFLALAAASAVLTYSAQRRGGAVASLVSLPARMRITNAVLSYAGYVLKMFWPVKLAVFYPLPARFPAAPAILAGIGLVAVTAAVIWCAPRRPWLATGWFWYLGTLVPVLGLVQVGSQAMADRYTYVPLIGLFIMLCWSAPNFALKPWILRMITCAAACVGLVVCAALSRVQVSCWKDNETLFRHALDETRDNWLAHNDLGVALQQRGSLQEAIGHYEQALQIKPDYAGAYNNLGVALQQTARLREAIVDYEQALRLQPDYVEAFYNLGTALQREGRVQEAIRSYEQTLRLRPDYAEAHNNLGVALLETGRAQDAIRHYEQALRIKPDYAEAHNDLGFALSQVGNNQDAIRHYEQALRIKPEYVEAHYNLGISLLHAGRSQDAISHLEQVVRMKPDDADAHNNLGIALSQTGNLAEGIAHYQQSLRIKPDDAEAHNNLGFALSQMDRADEAIRHCQQALRIKPDYAEAHNNLGIALSQAGKFAEGIAEFEQALRIKADYAEAHYNLGIALVQKGGVQDAMGHYEQALRIKPDYAAACNNLARLLATRAPAEGGNPLRAVALAQRACELTGNQVAVYLDTLATAYAGAGRFSDAVASGEKAVETARTAGQVELAKDIEVRLDGYRAGRPNF